jgi:hypothetical protein
VELNTFKNIMLIITQKYLFLQKVHKDTVFGLELELEDTLKAFKTDYLIIIYQDLTFKTHERISFSGYDYTIFLNTLIYFILKV